MKIFKLEPTVILWALNVGLGLLVSWGLKLSADETGAIVTIATAVITIINAVAVKEVTVALIKGTAATLLVAFTAFGFHLTADQIAYSSSALSILLGLLLRLNVTPVAVKGRAA